MRKKGRKILLWLMGAAAVCLCGLAVFVLQNEHWRSVLQMPAWMLADPPVIAHACGGIYGIDEDGNEKFYKYTNTKEALEQSLEKEYKLIELDLVLTTDGDFACTHSWPDEIAMSSQEWKDYAVKGQFTSQSLRDVLHIIKEMPDVYLVTDMKSEHSAQETLQEFTLLYEQILEVGGGQKAAEPDHSADL